jgi:hypothetical protein
VTQLVKKTGNGFTYTPVKNLAPGAHMLKIITKDNEGKSSHSIFKKNDGDFHIAP